MSSNRELSRRDLLRLPARRQTHDLLGAAPTSALAPVDEPPNHDGMDTSQLPPVHEALLAREQVAALFADIEQCAADVQLMVRRTAEGPAERSPPLGEVCRKLLAGEVSRLQIRYRWQDALWIDTLECTADGFRLVRIGHA